ncbi:DUF1761 domain-containing protein [Candidatus Dojkabacteria bacterium]|uniref:DUF1761 domain-containing protein n=1 Tax=Candidatus Dojkabacteria bacterium TaxID=2099670 RepID=A0A955LAL9_9BACT|nr:DUF1761 domain-containing protein [Candidatus Dojkabacteria bacterium]
MFELFNAEISVIGLVLAAIVNMLIGMLWFSPSFLGKKWLQLVNKSADDLQAMPLDYVLSIIRSLLVALGLNIFISYTVNSWAQSTSVVSISVFVGFIAWLSFVAMGSLNPVIWEGRRKQLYAFNMMHELVSTISMAIVVGLTI